jgi:putative salt-induced outer membrane protein YdiY
MTKHLIVMLIVVAFAGRCLGEAAPRTKNAQTNLVAAVASKKPPIRWNSSISLGLTATAGNSKSVLATSKFMSERKTPRDDWKIGADGAYGEANSVKSSECAHAFTQLNHIFVDDTWYGYGRAEGLHDAIANVAYRIAAGLGAGYYFIKDKQTTLSSETGPSVIYEKLDHEYQTYPTARIAENFEHKFDAHARIWQNFEILPPMDQPREFLLNAEIGVETPIAHNLSLQTYLQDNYANEPAPGFKDNDVKLVSGIVFTF